MHYCYLCFFLIASLNSVGQVLNDSIQNRTSLVLDDTPLTSSTNEATVEWKCINKALTNRCLTYHNDQWFTFVVPEPGRYYLNLSVENCSKAYGIQAIVIEGNPCEINTYKILYCIPRIKYREAFITLDSLKPKLSYLVNIDGFLGDFCNFDVGLSKTPHGLPQGVKSIEQLGLSVQSYEKKVALKWTLPEDHKDLVGFEVYRLSKRPKDPAYIVSIPVDLNSVGLARRDYAVTDSLTGEDTYTYQIMGRYRDERIEILDEHVVTFYDKIRTTKGRTLDFTLDYKNKTQLQILILDRYTDRVLSQTSLEFNTVLDRKQSVNVDSFVQQGIRGFVVRVITLKNMQWRDFEFAVGTDGAITLK